MIMQEEESEAVVFQTVLYYSLGILLVPIFTFISFKYTFDGNLFIKYIFALYL